MAKACFMYTFCHNLIPPIRFGGYSSKNADLILAWGGFAYFADFCCFQPRFWLFLRLLAAGNLLKMGGLAPRGSPTHFRRLPAACSLRKRQNLGRKHQKVSSMQPIGKEITIFGCVILIENRQIKWTLIWYSLRVH